MKNLLYFLKKSFCYISGKWMSYISENGTFKPKFKKITKIYSKKVLIFSYISGN